MIRLKHLLTEQLANVPAPAPGTYNLRFTINYRDGNREPVNEKNVQISEQDIKEFERNKSLYKLSNEDFWKDISGNLSSVSPKSISGIKVESSKARKPEFEIYIDSIDIGSTTITTPNDTTTYDDVKDDIQDQLDAEGQNFVKAKVEGRVMVGNNKYDIYFQTDDPDITADEIFFNDDSFEQLTGLDEQDILDKLIA